jgi:hypothetical protein
MIMPTVSWLPVLVATVLSFGLGALWYGPLFGKAWMAEHGTTAEELMDGFNPGVTYGVTFVLAGLSAFLFGVFIGEAPDFQISVGWGFAAGLIWVSGAIGTNYLFERRTIRLWLINGGYHTTRFTIIGATFGALG